MRSDSPANMADPEIEDIEDEEGEEEYDDGFINTDFLDSRRESVKVVSVLNTQKEILLEKLARFHQDHKVRPGNVNSYSYRTLSRSLRTTPSTRWAPPSTKTEARRATGPSRKTYS